MTTPAVANPDVDDGLRAFLLGDGALPRYVSPWVRFYHRAVAHGFPTRPHHDPCWECESEVSVAFDLPPTNPRLGDALRIAMCLSCGATGVQQWCAGEYVVHMIDGDGWHEHTAQVMALRAALEQRIYPPEDIEPETE